MVRTSQTARGRSLRTSTRIAALLGAAALSTVSGIAYAATQPAGLSHCTVQVEGSADPTDTPSDLPTGGPSTPGAGDTGTPGNGGPTETESPEPTHTGDGGSGGGGPQTGPGNQQGNGSQQGNGNQQSGGSRTGGSRQSGGQAGTSGDGLPVTGTDVTSIVVLGGMLTAGGAGLVLTTRRGHRASRTSRPAVR